MLQQQFWGELAAADVNDANVCVLGIPFDQAVSIGKGAALAPEKIRLLSRYMPATTETGQHLSNIKIYDAGDVPLDLNWQRYFATVEQRALQLLTTGKFCFFLGGDHSATIPLQKAWGRCVDTDARVGVIYLDAHLDLCHYFDGHSLSHACVGRRMLEHLCRPQDVTYIGIRSYEMEELDFVRATPQLHIIHARQVYTQGVAAVLHTLRQRYRHYDAIYISLDIDVLDPAYAPGTGTPEPGGLSSRELMTLVPELIQHLPVQVLDIMEVAPPLDHADITSWAALKIIYELLGSLQKTRL